MAHTIHDSHNLGFRKDNLAEEKDGSDDDVQGERNKVSWWKASQMTGQDTRSLTLTHSQINSHAETDVHFLMASDSVKYSEPATIYKPEEKISLIFFLLSGTD